MGFIIDWIVDSIRHNRVAKENQKSRGVVYYKPSQVGGFVEANCCYENTLVSGGDAEIRSEAIDALCIRAANAGQPVIVLHQSDIVCENKLRTTFSGFQNFYLANATNRIFDPLYGLNEDQIVDAIVKTAPKEYCITPDGGAYLSALTGTLRTKVRNIPLPALYSLIKNDSVPKLLQSAQLPPAVMPTIQNLYVRGQKEANSVNRYIYALKSQCDNVLPQNNQAYRFCCTLEQVVTSGGVLVLDVVSDMNDLYLRLLAEILNGFVRKGKRFLLILDGLAITEANGLKALLSSQNNAVGKAVINEDVYAACECNKDLFRMLLGRSQKWFVFRHMSDESAMQWSKGFGSYEKIETSVNIGRGRTDGSGFGTGHAGWSSSDQHNTGETLYHKEEAKVRSFEIQNMKPRQGFVYTRADNELAFITEFVR